MTNELDTITDAIAGDGMPHAHPRVAYIGVDGISYIVLTPVQSIWIRRVEGDIHDLGEWTFPSWHSAEDHLDAASLTAPKDGSYNKHDFKITWADGVTYGGRYDLTFGPRPNRLRSQVRDFLTWLRNDVSHTPQTIRKNAARMLLAHDMGQLPVPAPENWDAVHDYRHDYVDIATIQARHFSRPDTAHSRNNS
jgi:hypothetical protein